MVWLLPLLFLIPFVGAATNGVRAMYGRNRTSGGIALTAAALSFAVSVVLSLEVFKSGAGLSWSAPWIEMGTWSVRWGFRFDAFSALMALMVTFIGTFIHLYSLGYMATDGGRGRYFSYLNLFLGAMLLLVTADNLLVLFVGWEGVGLCSYLLIGFWYKDLKNSAAGAKAFLVNRIGDAGFLIGVFLCLKVFGSLDFHEMGRVVASTTDVRLIDLEWIALLLFIGAAGKSAQIPLFVWLPDAMAGPTPVSALIHAATMVTAGVYMICRMAFLYRISSDTSYFIALIGVSTAVFSATIACVQRDIKKVLAYSTISQLGLMFLAAGLGNYVASLFHVLTHAFFKACLFLGAGSIIHALGGEQDIGKMGGLRSKLPHTFATFSIATAAICGLPPFAGFFSKDAILFSALQGVRGAVVLWVLALCASGLTAFYMVRMYVLVFFGSKRWNGHPHESPPSMLIALWVTAVGSVVSGGLSLPHDWHLAPDFLGKWVRGVIPQFMISDSILISENTAMLVATLTAVASIGCALLLLGRRAVRFEEPRSFALVVLWNRYWVDELYCAVLVRPFHRLAGVLADWVDPIIIDGAVFLPARLVRASSLVISRVQSGRVQTYLMVMVVGVLLVIGWLKLVGMP